MEIVFYYGLHNPYNEKAIDDKTGHRYRGKRAKNNLKI